MRERDGNNDRRGLERGEVEMLIGSEREAEDDRERNMTPVLLGKATF